MQKDIARYTSIIFVNHAANRFRSDLAIKSLASLDESLNKVPAEIIVVDNGGFSTDSFHFLSHSIMGEIHCYIKNSDNMHFGFARNQGMAMAKGNYIAIVDNDLVYQEGWLEECLDVLEKYPKKKIYATPVDYPTSGLRGKYHQGDLKVGDKTYKLNMRAGSNCFVVRRDDFITLGGFKHHRVAGTVWTDNAVKNGFLAAVSPSGLVKDEGLRKGYNFKEKIPIQRTLTNGEKVQFNED